MSEPEIIGRKISEVTIIGEEHDGSDKWVAAQIYVGVPLTGHLGKYSIELVTKQHFLNLQLQQALNNLDQPERLLDESSEAAEAVESRPPYVLNDEELSEEVITAKFVGRVIGQDLAASMWPL